MDQNNIQPDDLNTPGCFRDLLIPLLAVSLMCKTFVYISSYNENIGSAFLLMVLFFFTMFPSIYLLLGISNRILTITFFVTGDHIAYLFLGMSIVVTIITGTLMGSVLLGLSAVLEFFAFCVLYLYISKLKEVENKGLK